MTIYRKEREFVKWNEADPKSVRQAEIKKSKLENQGYSLVKTIGGFYNFILEYKKDDQATKELNRKIREIFG